MKYIHLRQVNYELILFCAFIFLLPLNINKYLGELAPSNFNFESAFLYLSDILIIVMFILVVKNQKDHLKKIFCQKESLIFIAFLLSVLLIFYKNIAIKTGLFWYYFFELLMAYLIFIISQVIIKNRGFILSIIGKVFIFTMILQSLLIIGQFSMQKSLLSKVIGESHISPLIVNVAKVDLGSQKYIRGYGTFPHPNLTAVYLLTAIILLLGSMNYQNKIKIYLVLVKLGLLFIGLLLTFSRLAIILAISCVFIYLIYYRKFRLLIYLLCLLITLFYILSELLLVRFSYDIEAGFSLRSFLNNTAINIIKNNIYLGVGLGQFIENIKHYSFLVDLEQFMLEPVHNVYLLILAETGLIGFILFMCFVFMMVKKCFWLIKKGLNLALPLIFFSFLILGLFDHYFLTLSQGKIIFMFASSIITASLNFTPNKT